MPGKTSLRDKLDEDVLDLSLMQLNEVPVTEIVSRASSATSNKEKLLYAWTRLVYIYENYLFLGTIAERNNFRFVKQPFSLPPGKYSVS